MLIPLLSYKHPVKQYRIAKWVILNLTLLLIWVDFVIFIILFGNWDQKKKTNRPAEDHSFMITMTFFLHQLPLDINFSNKKQYKHSRNSKANNKLRIFTWARWQSQCGIGACNGTKARHLYQTNKQKTTTQYAKYCSRSKKRIFEILKNTNLCA